MEKKSNPEIIFPDIKSDELEPTIVQSLCVQCQENGKTTLLMVKVPFFRQLLIISFQCDQCGNKNREVQFAGKLPDFGVQILFKIIQKEDLNRQIIYSQHATIYFPQIDFQIPPTKKGSITTVQSLLTRTHQDLSQGQPIRKVTDIETYEKMQAFLQKLHQYMKGQKLPLTIKIRDPSGNSCIKNPYAPKLDKNIQIINIARTIQQLVQMGYSVENAKEQIRLSEEKIVGQKLNFSQPFNQENMINKQAVTFDTFCHSCLLPGQMRMCQTSIPYFNDLIIMSFHCQYCGAHSTDTKIGGQIKQQGCQIILNYNGNQKDLKRDLFKSDTCKVSIPQIQLQLDYGTLGGVYTTVQGLLEKIHDHLFEHNPFVDSDQQFKDRMDVLFNDIKDMRDGARKFTLHLIDPLNKSFLQNPFHPEQDPVAIRKFRKRTEQQEDFLGIADMKLQNYN